VYGINQWQRKVKRKKHQLTESLRVHMMVIGERFSVLHGVTLVIDKYIWSP